MRGKGKAKLAPIQAERITPSYAGKRRIAWCRFHLLEDHPRLCGEKLHAYFSMSNSPGSPPPMRGKG